MDKKYSLDEIDFMRWAVAFLAVIPQAHYTYGDNAEIGYLQSDLRHEKVNVNKFASAAFYRMENGNNEDQLRTLMQNGTTAEEMIEKIKLDCAEHEAPLVVPDKFQRWFVGVDFKKP